MRKAIRLVVLTVAVLSTGILMGRATGIFSGKRPESIGVTAGRFVPCNPTPNCVSSQAERGDTTHHIAALGTRGAPAQAFAGLKGLVRANRRASVVAEAPDYLHAEFRSSVFGFVDDVEFWLDAGGAVIHVRSASRVGRGDLGVNRERIELIRAQLAAGGG